MNVWFRAHGSETVFRTAGFTECLLAAGGVVWFYLCKAFLPVNLSFIYAQWDVRPGNFIWWLPLSAAIAVTIVLWLFRKSWGLRFSFAWGFFCVALIPVVGFIDVGFMQYSLVADHYQHIAIIAIIALTAAGWVHVPAITARCAMAGPRCCPCRAGIFLVSGLQPKCTLSRPNDLVPGHSGNQSPVLDGPQ